MESLRPRQSRQQLSHRLLADEMKIKRMLPLFALTRWRQRAGLPGQFVAGLEGLESLVVVLIPDRDVREREDLDRTPISKDAGIMVGVARHKDDRKECNLHRF